MRELVRPDPISIPADVTASGETAPEITASAFDDGYWLHQMTTGDDGGLRVHVIGMSWGQARLVRDALNRLLEPVFK